jgi:hypothetical protein
MRIITPPNYVQRRKYEKKSFCQLEWFLDNMHGDTYLKIVQDYLDENPPEIKKNDITSF